MGTLRYAAGDRDRWQIKSWLNFHQHPCCSRRSRLAGAMYFTFLPVPSSTTFTSIVVRLKCRTGGSFCSTWNVTGLFHRGVSNPCRLSYAFFSLSPFHVLSLFLLLSLTHTHARSHFVCPSPSEACHRPRMGKSLADGGAGKPWIIKEAVKTGARSIWVACYWESNLPQSAWRSFAGRWELATPCAINVIPPKPILKKFLVTVRPRIVCGCRKSVEGDKGALQRMCVCVEFHSTARTADKRARISHASLPEWFF